MKIGVFDSGVGGLSVANAISKARPDLEVIFKNDAAHMPYGSKSPDEVYELVVPIFAMLEQAGCAVIVVACNTVSTTLIERLRKRFHTPLIAIEPMVKPAALITKTRKITVCATPATLASERYQYLKQTYANNCTVFEPDCSDWAYLIEQNQMNEARLRQTIEPAIAAGSDVIVLGCTHYHWIEQAIKQIAGNKAAVMQPETAIARRLNDVIASLPGSRISPGKPEQQV